MKRTHTGFRFADDETLKAALAFIDEFGDESTSTSSGDNSDDIREGPVHHAQKEPRNSNNSLSSKSVRFGARQNKTIGRTCVTNNGSVPKRNLSRDRQRLEILQLRAEAEVLQKRVNEMREKQLEYDIDDSHWTDDISTRMASLHDRYQDSQCDTFLLHAWKDLSRRHRRWRKDSEKENKNYRRLYNTQLATIELLKKLLRNQKRIKRSVCFASKYYSNSYCDADDDALQVMDRLSGVLSHLYVDTDHVFLSNGLTAIACPFSQTNMNPISETGTNIEVLYCRVVPYSVKAVGEAFWHEMTETYVENEVQRDQVGIRSPRAAKAKAIHQAFTMELEVDGLPGSIQFRYAGKRHAEAKREVIVLSGQSRLLEAFGMKVDGVHFQEKHWLVISELSPGVSVVKVCMGMSVEIAIELPNRLQLVDRLCGMLIQQKQMGFESVLHGVEQNLLVA